ncbi:helix-turn-helix transcriptional regulator [Paenibacillus sp. LHD-38]|uniref:helix-turn-helix transcriptional regulator n=1 Tax=Paenibacillus sp. LHD-38 TaxID=3072143 RepID=UPI00280FC0E0|nr:helix-turn-helix transcriptional regulator [Paenibacillus sp. LHD-38]MDQ8734492.1 helix-turn-helix transcriptional regulator [Paenibacillus sp. LHD-38]
MKDVEHSFYSAQLALDRRFLLGTSPIMNGVDVPADLNACDMIKIRDAKLQYEELVQQGDLSQIVPLLEYQMEYFISQSVPKSVVQIVILDLFSSIFRLERRRVSQLDNDLRLPPEEYAEVMRASTIRELFQYAKEKCLDISRWIEHSQNSLSSNAIEQVKLIAKTEYANNISLKNIAEKIFMNPVYLGHLFKSVEGISFSDYLLKIRLEEAKQKLIYTDMKVYQIAHNIGYRQLDWFYRKFKEYTGLSASEFRSRYGNQNDKGDM